MDKTVQVLGPAGSDLVVVYKGIERESYSCAPECERRITLGDSPAYFSATLAQTGTRNGQAQTQPRWRAQEHATALARAPANTVSDRLTRSPRFSSNARKNSKTRLW